MQVKLPIGQIAECVVSVDERGNTTSPEFYNDVGFGLVDGCRRFVAMGSNVDVDTIIHEDIWSGGGEYPWMNVAKSLEVVSSSIEDASTGTGARTVLILGLDSNYLEISDLVITNGITPVALSKQFFRINNVLIMSTGSFGINVGTIDIRDITGGIVRAIVPIEIGISRQSQYTVPAGHSLQINAFLGSINRNSQAQQRYATISTVHRFAFGLAFPFHRKPFEFSVDGMPFQVEVKPGLLLTEKTDFGLRCTGASNDNTDLSAAYQGVLRRNV